MRFIISTKATREPARIADQDRRQEIKRAPLEDPRSTWAGAAAMFRTIRRSTTDDDRRVATLCLIFIIMLICTLASSRPAVAPWYSLGATHVQAVG